MDITKTKTINEAMKLARLSVYNGYDEKIVIVPLFNGRSYLYRKIKGRICRKTEEMWPYPPTLKIADLPCVC